MKRLHISHYVIVKRRQGAHLPYYGHEPVSGNITIVCDARPVRCQIYSFLSCLHQYQIIPLGNIGKKNVSPHENRGGRKSN